METRKILHKLKGFFSKEKERNFTELPSGVKGGLAVYLKSGEEILFTLRNFRAIYKAPRWLDSNTFFNSWLILTNSRVIIAKNSSSFKRFRDIPLGEIKQIDYETGALESRLTIESPGSVDIIEFLRESKKLSEDLSRIINQALGNFRNSGQHISLIFCFKCGNKVPQGSKFCSECGERL
ncbi:MAG TPA: PH domain-containing protein [Thermodesulfobacteriota bacterium]|nr:PH domain-containing protein [Thermodesulfobacteriota bacterium]